MSEMVRLVARAFVSTVFCEECDVEETDYEAARNALMAIRNLGDEAFRAQIDEALK